MFELVFQSSSTEDNTIDFNTHRLCLNSKSACLLPRGLKLPQAFLPSLRVEYALTSPTLPTKWDSLEQSRAFGMFPDCIIVVLLTSPRYCWPTLIYLNISNIFNYEYPHSGFKWMEGLPMGV